MEENTLTLIILYIALCGTAIANGIDKGAFGQVRLGYVNTDDTTSNFDSLAIGGKLGYSTNIRRGLSASGTFYTSQPVGGLNDNDLFFDSNNKGYSILGEAYINANIGKTSIKFGRQEIETPFANSNDFGMIPNTYESMMLINTSVTNIEIRASHLRRWAGVDVRPEPENFTKLNGASGINMLGVIYKSSDKWNAQVWHYNAKDSTNISYFETTISPFKNLGFGLQYADQNGGDSDGNVWGLIAIFETAHYTLSAAYNDVSNGQVINGYGGFGGGPFFTAAEINSIDGVINQEASALSIEYSGINRLTLTASYFAYNKSEDELDLIANYGFNRNLTTDLIFSDLNNNGSIARVFLNYNF